MLYKQAFKLHIPPLLVIVEENVYWMENVVEKCVLL